MSFTYLSDTHAHLFKCKCYIDIYIYFFFFIFFRKRSRKKHASITGREKTLVNSSSNNIDLESSGEFASVEKMLATTDANKFSTYLQTGAADLGGKRGRDEKTDDCVIQRRSDGL